MLLKLLNQSTTLLFKVYHSAFYDQCVFCLTSCNHPICEECFSQLSRLHIHCPICAEPNHHGHICGHCISREPAFDRVICPFIYTGCVTSIIRKIKKKPNTIMGFQLYQALLPLLQDQQFDLIIPVPYHWRRLLRRGHNPVRELTIYLAKQLNIPFLDALQRIKSQRSQQGLDRKQRLMNLNGVFDLTFDHNDRCLKGKNILLIDDVMTTGATCNSAALRLKRCGVKSISVACLARTPSH